ncbi:MAG: hypothetical protein AAF433_17360, partial [Bacteroidota bacterium]
AGALSKYFPSLILNIFERGSYLEKAMRLSVSWRLLARRSALNEWKLDLADPHSPKAHFDFGCWQARA